MTVLTFWSEMRWSEMKWAEMKWAEKGVTKNICAVRTVLKYCAFHIKIKQLQVITKVHVYSERDNIIFVSLPAYECGHEECFVNNVL